MDVRAAAPRRSTSALLAVVLLLCGGAGVRAQETSVGPAAPLGQGAEAAGPEIPAGPSQPTVQTALDYRIRQGDEVLVTVFGEPTLTPQGPLQVVPGGTISMPLAGNVRVSGLTTSQASNAVAARLRKYLLQPRVTVAVYAVGPIEALVLGNVKTPGKYTLPPPARLTDVLAAAGGLGPTDGPLPEARIQNYNGAIKLVSLEQLLQKGDTSLNFPIESGDTVYIPAPDIFNVRVVGAVDKPGDVALHDGDDLAIAVARAGTSSQANPDLNHISVTRIGPDGKPTVTTVDLYGVLKRGDLSHDLIMQKNDLVFIPTAKKGLGASGAGDLLYLLRSIIFP